jgi:hypothetical protein
MRQEDEMEVTKVIFNGADDAQVNWGGNDDPRQLLTVKEFPDKKFNSVSFTVVRQPQPTTLTDELCARINRFQDLCSWGPKESRNQLIGDIREAVRGVLSRRTARPEENGPCSVCGDSDGKGFCPTHNPHPTTLTDKEIVYAAAEEAQEPQETPKPVMLDPLISALMAIRDHGEYQGLSDPIAISEMAIGRRSAKRIENTKTDPSPRTDVIGRMMAAFMNIQYEAFMRHQLTAPSGNMGAAYKVATAGMVTLDAVRESLQEVLRSNHVGINCSQDITDELCARLTAPSKPVERVMVKQSGPSWIVVLDGKWWATLETEYKAQASAAGLRAELAKEQK